MTGFAVYDPATGAIRRYGTCAPADLARQAQAGEAVIATSTPAPDNKFKIDLTKSPPAVVPVAASAPA